MQAVSNGWKMSKILVIHDRDSAHSVVEEVLAEINIQPIVQHIDLYDEYDFSASPFDLFIFELHRDSRKGILLLQRLAKISVTSGVSFPPVIVVSAENTDDIEQMARYLTNKIP